MSSATRAWDNRLAERFCANQRPKYGLHMVPETRLINRKQEERKGSAASITMDWAIEERRRRIK